MSVAVKNMEIDALNKYKTLAVVVVIICLLIGAFFLIKSNQTNQAANAMKVFNKKYSAGEALQTSGDYSGALNTFNTLLKDAPGKAAEGRLKIFIATNLLLRNEGNDQSKGMQMYKEVLNDQQMPAKVRSSALIDLASFIIKEDETFYRTYFNDPPFNTFLPSSGTSSLKTLTAYLKMLQLSDEIYPNSFAEYLIAGSYYRLLLNYKSLRGTTTPEQIARTMQEYVKRADVLAPTDQSSYKPFIMLTSYYYRARAINRSSDVLKNISLVERENAWKLALVKGAPYENGKDFFSIDRMMLIRLRYALFLNINFGKERYADIINLLKPFGRAVSSSDTMFKMTRARFTSGNVFSTSSEKNRVLALAKISPEFKEFLTSVGLEP